MIPKLMPIFWGTIGEDGRLIIHDQKRLKEYLTGLKKGEVEITIRRWRKNRTLPQNSFYWAVILELVAEYTGMEIEEVHQTFERKFLSYRKFYKGRSYPFVRRCSSLSTAEFSEYIDKIIAFASQEFGIMFPQPNEVAPIPMDTKTPEYVQS